MNSINRLAFGPNTQCIQRVNSLPPFDIEVLTIHINTPYKKYKSNKDINTFYKIQNKYNFNITKMQYMNRYKSEK